jgi:hypothetical protein
MQATRYSIKRLLLIFALAIIACDALLDPGGASAGTQPLILERTIPLPHVFGRIDHMAIDLARKRLIIAELGNGSVDVIDLGSGALVHRFDGVKQPQGLAYLPGPDLILVASGGDGSLEFYGGGDFSHRGSVPLGEDADNIRIDPGNQIAIVGYGNGGLAIVDTAHQALRRSIALPAHPESFELDPHGSRVYVNIPDAKQLAVVDLASGRQVAKWQVPGLAENFPLAIDATGAELAVVFRSPPRLVLLDSRAGKVLGRTPTCTDADDASFDSSRKRIYVSCGEGVVDVFGQSAAGTRHIARIPTLAGARTSLFVPELDRLFVAARAGELGTDAAILVFRPE